MAQLTKRGLIAAVVCSDSFMKLGTAQAKVFGVPDLPLLQIQHPLGGLNMDKVRERAAVALPQLLEAREGQAVMSSLDEAARRRPARCSRSTTIPKRSTNSCARKAGATACRSSRRRPSASSACSPTATAISTSRW